jgi:hypothetical protein
MKYWVTTHWPHSVSEDASEPHSGVYVPDGRESSVASMSPGDIVFIYESKYGRTEKRTLLDGAVETIPSHVGKEGIVTIVKVASDVYEDEDASPTEYTDGSKIWWRYVAETAHITAHGLVPRQALNKVLGYAADYNLRGFGDMHSGVKEITSEQAEELLSLFSKGIENELATLLKAEEENRRSFSHFGSGGEGELHKTIKYAIQDNPELLLGEEGLCHVKTEYLFSTSDRVDILLIDKFKRFVVVEVEPACENGYHIGTAQCMKYRSLMAFESDRREHEVRAILAAPTVSKDVLDKAIVYDIEVKLIQEKHLTLFST